MAKWNSTWIPTSVIRLSRLLKYTLTMVIFFTTILLLKVVHTSITFTTFTPTEQDFKGVFLLDNHFTISAILSQSQSRNILDTKSILGNKTDIWYKTAISRLWFRGISKSKTQSNDTFYRPKPEFKKFVLDNTETIKCSECSNSTELIFLILSIPNRADTRNDIRKSWGSVRITHSWPGAAFKMDIRLLFVIGTSVNQTKQLQHELKSEAETFDDILQVTTIDSYSNLTAKVLSGFRWISKNCASVRYVVKADVDVFVNVPLLWKFLEFYGQQNTIYGHIYFNGKVMRNGRWAISEKAMPVAQFPPYASGTSYVLSIDVIFKILKTYSLFHYIPIEDAFLTGVLATVAKVNRVKVMGFTRWKINPRRMDPCEFVTDSKYMETISNQDNLKQIWSEIVGLGNGKCISNVNDYVP